MPSADSDKPAARPVVCSEMKIVHFSDGKPGATVADVTAALEIPDNPLGHARNVLGDTRQTKDQIKANNAVLTALCGSK